MFWGLIMEPGRCYTQKVKVSFHVSMAALDVSNSSDEPAQVMCVFEGRNYLLCTLNKKDKLQCPLDLNFEVGSKVSFATNGKAHVHLTGYLTNFDDDLLEDAEAVEEEQEEEEQEDVQPSKKKAKRAENNDIEAPPSKKSKKATIAALQTTIEEEESSDSDFDVQKLMSEEAEDEDSNEEEEDDEEASSLTDEEEEEESEAEEVKPKLNGINQAKKGKQEEKPAAKSPQKTKVGKKEEQNVQQKKLKKSTLKNGVVVQDIKEGNGEPVKNGKFVHVYYEGRLKDNNKLFDATTKGPGFSFRVGKGEVIQGWDIGLVGMKVGGKRRVICPPKVGYGAAGSPPVIPPNATLVFDIEVRKIS